MTPEQLSAFEHNTLQRLASLEEHARRPSPQDLYDLAVVIMEDDEFFHLFADGTPEDERRHLAKLAAFVLAHAGALYQKLISKRGLNDGEACSTNPEEFRKQLREAKADAEAAKAERKRLSKKYDEMMFKAGDIEQLRNLTQENNRLAAEVEALKARPDVAALIEASTETFIAFYRLFDAENRWSWGVQTSFTQTDPPCRGKTVAEALRAALAEGK